MVKTTFSMPIDGKLLAEAQRLVDAGEFDNLAQMIEGALRDYLQNFDAASSDGRDAPAGLLDSAGHTPSAREGVAGSAALEAYVLHGMIDSFDPQQRGEYEHLVEAYSTLVQHPLADAEMGALAEIYKTFRLEPVLSALDEAQHSKVPLSPAYLGALLSRRQESAAGAAPQGLGSFARIDSPARVYADFDNPLAAEVASLYQKEIGELTEKVRDQIATYIVEFPDLQRWHAAFEAAAGMNKRSLRYVLGVLRGNGVKVVEPKGRDNRGLSKSERHREAKRSRNKDYKDYWDAKLKTQQNSKPE